MFTVHQIYVQILSITQTTIVLVSNNLCFVMESLYQIHHFFLLKFFIYQLTWIIAQSQVLP